MSHAQDLSVSELSSLLESLGVPRKAAQVTQEEVDVITFPYQGRLRRYHDVDHLDEMSQGALPDTLKTHLISSSLGLSLEESGKLAADLAQHDRSTPQTAKAESILDQASAILQLSGLLHDCAYKQIDGAENESHVWPLILKRQIEPYLNAQKVPDSSGKAIFTTYLTDQGKDDRITKMVADIFAVSEDGLPTTKGGNEFDSAVVAAKFLEKHSAIATARLLEEHGVDEKAILAVVACIAATYPFQPATDDQHPDGYMGRLAQRLHDVSSNANPPVDINWNDINKIMLLAVQTANDDVADFFGSIPHKSNASFTDIAHGAVLLKAEEIADLHPNQEEDATIQDLMRLATLSRSAPFLYKQMQNPDFPIQPKNVPHYYMMRDNDGNAIADSHYPSQKEYNAAVERVRDNITLAADYFEAKKVGVTVVAAIEKLARKPDEQPARVLDFVKGNIWETWPPQKVLSGLPKRDRLIYDALAGGRGKGYVSKLEIDKSPTAGVVFGYAGKQGMDELYNLDIDMGKGKTQKLKDMDHVETDAQANQILHAVIAKTGMEGLNIITSELARVALSNNHEEREKTLLAIPDRFRISTKVSSATATAIASTQNMARG